VGVFRLAVMAYGDVFRLVPLWFLSLGYGSLSIGCFLGVFRLVVLVGFFHLAAFWVSLVWLLVGVLRLAALWVYFV
jgi:hypothetical protein